MSFKNTRLWTLEGWGFHPLHCRSPWAWHSSCHSRDIHCLLNVKRRLPTVLLALGFHKSVEGMPSVWGPQGSGLPWPPPPPMPRPNRGEAVQPGGAATSKGCWTACFQISKQSPVSPSGEAMCMELSFAVLTVLLISPVCRPPTRGKQYSPAVRVHRWSQTFWVWIPSSPLNNYV